MSSTNGLLAAIEGYSAEHAGSAEHESNIKLMQRVAGNLKANKASDTSNSPGAREAKAAAQVNMGAEEGHSGGEGNKTTNAPATARHGEPPPNPQEHSKGTVSIGGTGPERSAGNVRSTLAGPPAHTGVVDIRRSAALKALESEKSSAGNVHPNSPGHADSNEARIGDVKAPAATPPDRNTNPSEFEKTPQTMGKDKVGKGWGKAAEAARRIAPSAR